MIINGKPSRTVWMEEGVIKTINQPALPERFEIVSLHDAEEVAAAIRTMVVRGAPAIGALGAYGLAQAVQQLRKPDLAQIEHIRTVLEQTRPTAHDLKHGLDHVFHGLAGADTLAEMKSAALDAVEDYAQSSIEACRRIGEYGNTLIKDGDRILTHCNAGAVATVDYGTALAVVRMAHYDKKSVFVYVDETRPRMQGSKITAWELLQEGIPHAIIADNAAGHFMQRGDIDIVLTGADRIALNGDTANKIGTYEKAVLARENSIPFYIAAPLSTIDFTARSGEDIPIEERGEEEVLEFAGRRVAPSGSTARNPAFDVTPARYITGIITEEGIFKPGELKQLSGGHD